MQALAEDARQLPVRHRVHDLRDEPRRTPRTSWPGPAPRGSTSSSTCCGSPTRCSTTRSSKEKIGFHEREEDFMRKFFLDRVQEESVLSGQSFMYLHYADMIANGYKRTMPCPFQSQGLLLNPNGDLHYCENSREARQRPRRLRPESLYFKAENLMHRAAAQGQGLPDLPQPVPGERRRDEAVRAVREVPQARLPGEERSAAASRHDARPRTSSLSSSAAPQE